MMESSAKTSTKYLEELSILLRSQGFTVHPRESRDIDVEHDGSTLCRINDLGNLGYFEDKISGKESVLDRIRETARSTREYMTLLKQAPPLVAEGLSEGYQLLAEFNGTVLAGHMTRYGAQFVTWEWVHNKTALWQGHYYGVGDSGGYPSAKRDFAVRSGLLPASALFTPEQLTEVYRSIHETLGSEYPLTDERRKLLESSAEQIECGISDLNERVGLSNDKELEYNCISVLQPEYKDWNEDLKAAHGLPALPAEEHPQLIVAPDVCQLIAEKCEELKPDSLGSLEKELPRLLLFFQNHVQHDEIGKATLRADEAATLWGG